MQSKTLTLISTAILSTLLSTNTHATGAIAGAIEPTQLLNNVELGAIFGKEAAALVKQGQQIANELYMIQNQLENLKDITPQQFQDAIVAMNELGNIVSQGATLSYKANNYSSYFTDKFSLGNSSSAGYGAWSQQINDSIRNSLNGAGLNASKFQGESDRLKSLREMSENSDGRLQALQVSNHIAGDVVEQMQKLRQLVMQDTALKANEMSVNQNMVDTKKAEKDFYQRDTIFTNSSDDGGLFQ